MRGTIERCHIPLTFTMSPSIDRHTVASILYLGSVQKRKPTSMVIGNVSHLIKAGARSERSNYCQQTK
jgi:hypothetical protein